MSCKASEPSFFCPQCGPLRGEHPIDEDGTCASCGASTCSWADLLEHLRDEGYELVREPLTAAIDRVRELSSTDGREPAELSGVVRRAYFEMLTAGLPMPAQPTESIFELAMGRWLDKNGWQQGPQGGWSRAPVSGAAPPSEAEKLSENVCRHDGFSHTRNVSCPKDEE
jgi:hypothetical protein